MSKLTAAVSRSVSRASRYQGTAGQAALAQLAEQRQGQLDDTRVSSAIHQTRDLGGNTLVRIRQEAGGVPVRGAEAAFLVDTNNAVLASHGGLRAIVNVNPSWPVYADEVRAALKQRFPGAPDEIPLERCYVLREGMAEPYWDATVITPRGEWSVLVSGLSGEIERVDSLRWGQAQGYAFASNPVTSQVSQVQLGNLTSNANLTGSNAKVYSYLPNLLSLAQPRVFLQVAEPVGGNYLYAPSDRRFSEVQLYHGIDRVALRFRELGFAGFGRALEGVVLYQDYVPSQAVYAGKNNAYFSPVEFSNRGGLFFYLTSRYLDTSWDSDVIFHEYTHAVVNQLVGRNQGNTFRAINEGTADYFAASFLDDPAMAEWAARIFGERLPYLRTVDNTNRWPNYLVGEEHVDGNIWSGALWDIRKALGADRTNRIVLNALALLNGGAEFFDGAVAVVAAAKGLYGDAVAQTAAESLVNRGVGSDDAATAANARQLRSGVSTQASVSAATAGSQILGAQQFRIDVPNQATGLRIQLTASGNMRFFIRYRAPITIQDGQLVYEQFTATPGTSLAGTLTLSNTPELQSGTYYIGVTNTTTAAVSYTLTATITGGSATAGPTTTVLTSGERSNGSAPGGPFLASRQFVIDVPNGATGLSVALSGNRDVDLYIKKDEPIFANSQGFPEADYVSATDASAETIAIDTRSLPEPLRPGRYYIGVLNYSGETASYSVTATISNAAVAATQTQALAPDTPVTINALSGAGGSLLPQQFSITVPADAYRLDITASTQLDAVLIVKKDSAYVAGGLFNFLTSVESGVEIGPDSSPALQGGATYFVAVGNFSSRGGPITLRYSITRRTATVGQISAAGVVSAASFQGSGVAPGEIITIFGSNIGPPALTGLAVSSGRVATRVGDTRVLFDDTPAPLIYVAGGQLSCVVPYNVASKSSVGITVEYQGQNSNTVNVPVQATRPAVFTANSSGAGQGAILNQNNSVNSSSNPADRNSVVVLYATGEGATTPAGLDGQIASAIFPKPNGAVAVTIGGANAEVLYAGAAPGLVAGVFQVNVRVPQATTPGSAVPVQVRVGNTTSRTGVTLAVR